LDRIGNVRKNVQSNTVQHPWADLCSHPNLPNACGCTRIDRFSSLVTANSVNFPEISLETSETIS
jgi:hypothetical protein